MESFRIKVDSMGRIRIPVEAREELGESVLLKKTPQGLLIVPVVEVSSFIESFVRAIQEPPPRTGEPENWPPNMMRGIWR